MSEEDQEVGRHRAGHSPQTPGGWRVAALNLQRGRDSLFVVAVLAFISTFPITVFVQRVFSSSFVGLSPAYAPLLTSVVSILAAAGVIFFLAGFRRRQQERDRGREFERLRATEQVLFQDLELDVDNLTQEEPYRYGK